MIPSWLKKTVPIAALFSLRMLGLFMLIPVFTVNAHQLRGAMPWLLGIALGAYGLTQGILQIPFGILSDRYGRKKIISIGLILFIIGSAIGATTDSIYGMIAARIIQGTGAIGSVLIAYLADVTSERDRTKAMAVVGITVGISFSLAMVLSPALTEMTGLSGIFYLCILLAILGLAMLHSVAPEPQRFKHGTHNTININQLKQVFLDRNLQRLNIGIFFLHFTLVSTFFALPIILQTYIQQKIITESWHLYLPLLVGAFLTMLPIMLIAEKKKKIKALFIGSITTIFLMQLTLACLPDSFPELCIEMFLYFVAFNLLEASLPSLISKQASPDARGCAMGFYSSSQFFGIFFGGALSGIVFQGEGSEGIFIMNSIVVFVWLLLTLSLNVSARNTQLVKKQP